MAENPGGAPVSAHDVAAAIRARLPGVPTKKLHKLLYYCQGHHLAAFDVPLFTETIVAWDTGPVVSQLWRAERDGDPPVEHIALDEAQLNTVGYVISRYGALTERDLEILTHGETPWRRADAARKPGGDVRVDPAWIRDYFAADDAYDPVPASVQAWLKGAVDRRREPMGTDDVAELAARLRRGA
jgi:uncharacterized phage-associated protein